MRETRRAQLVVGLFVAAALAVFALMAFELGGLSLRPRIHGVARFDDVTGLPPGARVTVAGVAVGSVRALSVENGRARVDLVLYAGHGITEGARAEVRARSLLGEKYLAIIPAATPGAALSDGFVLPSAPPAPSVDDVLARLATALDKLPFDALADDMTRLDAFLKEALPRLDAALKSADLGELAAAAHALRVTLDEERPALHRTLQAAATLAESYQGGARATAQDLQATLHALREASEKVAAIDTTQAGADMERLRRTLDKLPGTLERIDRVLVMLEKLGPAVDRLSTFDEKELHRLLREEGVRIRLGRPDDGDGMEPRP